MNTQQRIVASMDAYIAEKASHARYKHLPPELWNSLLDFLFASKKVV